MCAAAAAAAVVPFALSSFSGDTGTEITASLVDDAMPITLGSITAVLVSAGLFLAAARLGAVVSGIAGRIVATAGAAVAMMFALYYASFGAGAIVAAQMLSEPGAGVGEGTALLVNLTEVTRYAPGLALVVAAFMARRSLPRPVGDRRRRPGGADDRAVHQLGRGPVDPVLAGRLRRAGPLASLSWAWRPLELVQWPLGRAVAPNSRGHSAQLNERAGAAGA